MLCVKLTKDCSATEKPSVMPNIRRSKCLIAFWEDTDYTLENYLTHKQSVLSPLVIHLLNGLDHFQPKAVVLERFASLPEGEAILEQLLQQNILVTEGTDLACQEDHLKKHWTWKEDAAYFLFSTKVVHYQEDPELQDESLMALAKSEPPPSIFKDYKGKSIRLAPPAEANGEFWKTLQLRRTRRQFKNIPLGFEDFSNVLRWTWGKTRQLRTSIGEYLLKTSPSGGARHPGEVYPLVLNVKGLAPGLYHYSVRNHDLNLLRTGDFQEKAVELCARQPWVRNAAVVFFMTAFLPRNMWKYRHSRALRVVLLETGHLGQTFHLVCTALGLAPFTTAATYDEAIEAFLEIDGIEEVAIYTAITGYPAKDY